MRCPYCNENINDGATRCPFCHGGIKHTSTVEEFSATGVDSETIIGAQKILAVVGAVAFPILYYWLFADPTFTGVLKAIGIGAFVGFFSPYFPVARKK